MNKLRAQLEAQAVRLVRRMCDACRTNQHSQCKDELCPCVHTRISKAEWEAR
jgi:hypothetical protein